MPATAIPRVRPFTGILNFRDYGGYALSNGGRLREGRLFRSAQHREATADDLAAVGAIGLASVIDLRGPQEREVAPGPRPEGFAARVLFSEVDTSGLAFHIEAMDGASTAEKARAAMIANYAGMPFRAGLIPALRHYFNALATIDGPSLVHCAAGKDRTGLACALLHAMTGVHRDDLIGDYLLTNEASDLEARIAAVRRHQPQDGRERLPDETIAVFFSVEPAFIETALDAIDERHGSLDAYLRDVLDVDAAKHEAILAHVVA